MIKTVLLFTASQGGEAGKECEYGRENAPLQPASALEWGPDTNK